MAATIAGYAFLLLVTACGSPDSASLEENPAESSELPITDGHGFGVNDELPKYTVSLERCYGPSSNPSRCEETCTGTIVGSNWIITAAHCMVGPDQTIHFYAGGNYSSDTRHVAEVKLPYGATPSTYSVNGRRQDIALVRMDQPIPLGGQYKAAFITLNPGGIDPVVGKEGWVVGAGLHDGQPNNQGLSKGTDARVTEFGSAINTMVTDAKVNSGDSGGGFFTLLGSSVIGRMELVGVLSATDNASGKGLFTYLGGDMRLWIASVILN